MNYNDYTELLKESLSTTLKEKRVKYHYTVSEAAEKCCITDKQYYNLEHGHSLPEFQTLINIILTFDIDFNQFVHSVIEQGYKPVDEEK